MINIYGTHNEDKLEKSQYNKALEILPIEQKRKINSKIRREDKEIQLLSQILLRYTLKCYYNLKEADVNLVRTEYGKPMLKNSLSLHFNISHSGNYVFLAVSNTETGIDIEQEKSDNSDIAQNFYSKEENIYLSKQLPEEKKRIFYKIWSLKESYIKALGLGLNKDLNSFSAVTSGGDVRVKDFETPENSSLWQLFYREIVPGYHLSVCYHIRNKDPSIEIINSTELMNLFLSGAE